MSVSDAGRFRNFAARRDAAPGAFGSRYRRRREFGRVLRTRFEWMLQARQKIIALRVARLSIVAFRHDDRLAKGYQSADRHELVALRFELRNGDRQRFGRVPAAPVGVPD